MFDKSCDKQVFTGLTPERFSALEQQAAAGGIAIAGDSGTATTNIPGAGDITMTWDYDRAAQTLTLQVTDKPMFIPCSAIASRVQNLVDAI